MRTLKGFIAVLCAILMLHPAVASAQQGTGGVSSATYSSDPSWVLEERSDGGPLGFLVNPYKERLPAAVQLGNSSRLDALLRGGNLYLSLRDAIALVLENNLDISVRRLGPQIADADILRANAGNLLQGVDTTVQQGPQSVGGSGVLGTASTVGVGGGGAGGGANIVQAGGLTIQQIGAQIPTLDPVVQFQSTWFHRTTPVTAVFLTGTNYVVQNTNSQNFTFQQGLLTGGAVTFAFNNSGLNENTPPERNSLNPNRQGSARLSFSQPLLQGFGRAVNSRFIRISKNNRQISDLTFKRQVIETVSSVIRLYWDLVSLREEVKVKRQALELADKLLSDNKKQVEIGTLAPIEIVRAEAQVATGQQELTQAESNVLQQELIIKNALSKTGLASPSVADARIIPTDTIRIEPSDTAVPMSELVDRAVSNRPELAQVNLQLENTKLQIKGNKSQLRPTLNFFVTATNNGLAGSENSNPPLIPGSTVLAPDPFFLGGTGRVWEQLARRNFPDYGIGFTLNIPLRNRFAQGALIQGNLQLRQQEIQQRQLENTILQDVKSALIGLQQARARYDAAQKSRILNEQTLDAEQKKYALGASTIFLVIQAQRDLAAARSVEVAALSQYSAAQVQLYRSTGEVLDRYDVKMDEAMKGEVARAPDPLPAGGSN